MPTSRNRLALPILTLTAAAAALIACGGGGGSDPASAPPLVNFGNSAPLPAVLGGSSTMSCVDGAGFQCSGTFLRKENGVTVTNSGVQVYGHSTSDLAANNQTPTTATGLEPDDGNGLAETRFQRVLQGNALAVTRAALLLSNVGISWDGINPRPQTIEVFEKTQGETKLAANGSLSIVNPLHAPTDMNYYNYAGAANQRTPANYANNRYFPRPGDPTTCPTPPTPGPTTFTETCGVVYTPGPFRSGGTDPDRTTAKRLHSDGDVKAGTPPGPVTGVPFAGNKGYRDLIAFSFDYANLATWASEETVEIDEWANASNEHTSNRRGAVAFGAATDPNAVPAAGGVDYKGVVYGWYTPDGASTVFYRAAATVSVNFDSRQVAVRISDAKEDGTATAVPFTAEITTGLGKAGENAANYFTGALTASGSTALSGGLGGRLFGPVGQGPFTANQGPAEIAGSFTLKNATTKAATIGGFIGRRQ